MTIDVTTDIVIARPIADVAAFAGDPSNAPLWYSNIETVEWMTPPPVQTGSRMEFVARFLGRRLQYTYEIASYEPGERLVMRTAQGPFAMETTYEWQAAGEDQTRMSLRNRGDPGGFSKIFSPFIAFAVRRANQNDLRRLKKRLESGA